ncbi:MAG: ABC transporter substrate-binding protein [Oscillospiraceae bacterium]|nr:ABC transporter substrate-binding protein [Oscillospiraceae bacterium]
MKKLLCIVLALAMLGVFVAACDNGSSGEMYIAVVSKGFQHQFWQAVKQGSDKAAEDFGVKVHFDGPEGESAIADQVNMLNAELAKNPDAIALAALDTSSVLSQLADAQARGIPVIGFDSGVPEAPAGQVAANASTNNEAAGAIGADNMFPEIKSAIEGATADNPVVIAILSQEVTSASITGRTKGFAEKMFDLASGANSSVAITGGYAAINKGDAGAAVNIEVIVGATPELDSMINAANTALNLPNLQGIFMSNEGAVSGLLAALNAGASNPGALLVGFDAGEAQKAAVRTGLFFGSITQDPVSIGYKAVELAVKAARGEPVSDVDTGAKWYNAANMDQADIAVLLYD